MVPALINKLFVDFDGTMVNSIKKMVELYNEDYRAYPGYKWVDWFLVNSWDFKECSVAPKEYFEAMFNRSRFFDHLDFMDDQEDVFWYIVDEFFGIDHTTVVTMGQEPNLKLKEEHLVYNYNNPDYIGLDIDKYNDKSSVDMLNGVFIDDSSINLKNSNAPMKICFGRVYPWNEDWDGIRCKDWYEVLRYLKLLEAMNIIQKRKVVEECK